jgi:hypothetical protein
MNDQFLKFEIQYNVSSGVIVITVDGPVVSPNENVHQKTLISYRIQDMNNIGKSCIDAFLKTMNELLQRQVQNNSTQQSENDASKRIEEIMNNNE